MYLKYDESLRCCIVFYEDKDKCRFCKHCAKCPLISALQMAEYCIPIRDEIPTWEFCELYEPNQRITTMERNLKSKKKFKER